MTHEFVKHSILFSYARWILYLNKADKKKPKPKFSLTRLPLMNCDSETILLTWCCYYGHKHRCHGRCWRRGHWAEERTLSGFGMWVWCFVHAPHPWLLATCICPSAGESTVSPLNLMIFLLLNGSWVGLLWAVSSSLCWDLDRQELLPGIMRMLKRASRWKEFGLDLM